MVVRTDASTSKAQMVEALLMLDQESKSGFDACKSHMEETSRTVQEHERAFDALVSSSLMSSQPTSGRVSLTLDSCHFFSSTNKLHWPASTQTPLRKTQTLYEPTSRRTW